MSIKKNISMERNEKKILSLACGVVIKRLRRGEGMTGSELAKKLNISQQQMSRYERGINKFSIDLLFHISIILKISFEKLIKIIMTEFSKLNSDNVEILTQCLLGSENKHFF